MRKFKFDVNEPVIKRNATSEAEAGKVWIVCEDRDYRQVAWDSGDVTRVAVSHLMYLDDWRRVKGQAKPDYWTSAWKAGAK